MVKILSIKKIVAGGMVGLMAVPLILASCANGNSTTTPTTTLPPTSATTNTSVPTSAVPPLNSGVTTKQLEFTYDQLAAQKTISQTVEVKMPGSVILTLGSNPTTGFQWPDQATIGDSIILSQYSHQFVQPTTNLAGAPGKDVYVFKTLAAGTSTIQLQYSRPWEGGRRVCGRWRSR